MMRQNQLHSFSARLEKAVSLTDRRSPLARYGFVVIICIIATSLFLGTNAILGTTSPFLFLLGGVLVSAWFGGVWAGVLTLLYGLFLGWVTFIHPAMAHNTATLQRTYFQTIFFAIESPLILFLIHKRNKTYEEMQSRAAQQSVIATIGAYGLEEDDLSDFMDRIVRAVSKTLSVDYVTISELLPDEDYLRVCAGYGWRRGIVGKSLIDAKHTSQASYTLQVQKPVVMPEFAKEKRFKGASLQADHNIVSGASVIIPGHPRPFGVLSVHTKQKRLFTKDDVNFLLSLAHVLSTTIERSLSQRELELMASLNNKLVSLDPKLMLTGVVETIVPNFAELCEVYLKTAENEVELVEVKTTIKEKDRIYKELAKKYPPIGESKRPTAYVLRSGKPIYYARVPESFAVDASGSDEQIALLKKANLLSTIIVPIKIRHKTVGSIGFGSFSKGRIYSKRDFLLAQEIADRVAVAIDNANLYQEARSAVQARDEFLSIASHELKTPLTSMLLQLQTVLHSIKSQSLASFSIEQTMTSLESTITQSKRLSKLVNDLLNFSLITTGRLELEREKTDLTKIAHEVGQRLQEQAKKSGSELKILDGQPIVGNWDRIRIEQVVTNLLTNAIKYGDGKPIEVEVSDGGKQAKIRVTDHGLGISQEQQEKIFNRFQRGEVKSSIKGLGVGLYLVSEIVRAHKGKIAVSSKPKAGSTFTVQLPR